MSKGCRRARSCRQAAPFIYYHFFLLELPLSYTSFFLLPFKATALHLYIPPSVFVLLLLLRVPSSKSCMGDERLSSRPNLFYSFIFISMAFLFVLASSRNDPRLHSASSDTGAWKLRCISLCTYARVLLSLRAQLMRRGETCAHPLKRWCKGAIPSLASSSVVSHLFSYQTSLW